MTEKNKIQEANLATENKTQTVNVPSHIAMESTIGAVALLAAKSPTHKYLFASDYEWLFLPPIANKQCVLFRNKNNEPIAFVSYAAVSEEVEKRLLSGAVKLAPKDWKSGDKIYIIDIISPFIAGNEILKQLNSGQFKEKNAQILAPNKDKKGFQSLTLEEAIKIIPNNENKADAKKAA